MITLYADGSGQHSNGLASACFVAVRDDSITYVNAIPLCKKHMKVLGVDKITNNVAEYIAVSRAIGWAHDNGHTEIQIFTDSQLVVKQFNKEYRANSSMAGFLMAINKMVNEWNLRLTISWVPRQNKFIQEADAYGRRCIKNGTAIE